MRRYVIRQEVIVRIFDENENQIGFNMIHGDVAVDIRGRELEKIIDDKAEELARDSALFAKTVLTAHKSS